MDTTSTDIGEVVTLLLLIVMSMLTIVGDVAAIYHRQTFFWLTNIQIRIGFNSRNRLTLNNNDTTSNLLKEIR